MSESLEAKLDAMTADRDRRKNNHKDVVRKKRSGAKRIAGHLEAKAAALRAEMIEALRPFAWYFDVNDCKDRREDDALEVPIRDLRIAFELFEALGLPVTPIHDAVGQLPVQK